MIWWPRQMPNTGTLPSSAATLSRASVDRGRDRRDRSRGRRRRARARARRPPACRRGHDLDLAAGRDELVEDRALDPEVVRDDEEASRRRGRPCTARAVVTAATRSRPSVPPSACAAASSVSRIGGAERARHRAGVADVAGEAAGVDAGDARRRWWRRRKPSRSSVARQFDGRRARSRTITPRQCGARASSSSALMP